MLSSPFFLSFFFSFFISLDPFFFLWEVFAVMQEAHSHLPNDVYVSYLLK